MSRRRRLGRLYQSSKSKYKKRPRSTTRVGVTYDIAFKEGELEECDEELARCGDEDLAEYVEDC